MMIREFSRVETVEEVGENIFTLTFTSPLISQEILPGQFVNIKGNQYTDPLLRRPFSVYLAEQDRLSIIFNVIGRATTLFRNMKIGDSLDVLGPLGVPYDYDSPTFHTAVLMAGGLGVAPFGILTSYLKRSSKTIITLLGAQTSKRIVTHHLEGVRISTDDGSSGMRGTVVDLARTIFHTVKLNQPKIFACGPNKMLEATARMADEFAVSCEVSLEGPMACGFGICQGCPVEIVGQERKYSLMCKDGPVFDSRSIRFPR